MWSLIKIGWLTGDTQVTILRTVTDHEQALQVFLGVYNWAGTSATIFPLSKKGIHGLYCGTSQKSLADTIKSRKSLVSISVLVRTKMGSWIKLQEPTKPTKRFVEMSVRYLLVFPREDELILLAICFSPGKLLAKQLSGYVGKSCLCVCSNGFWRILLAGDSFAEKTCRCSLVSSDWTWLKPLGHILHNCIFWSYCSVSSLWITQMWVHPILLSFKS